MPVELWLGIRELSGFKIHPGGNPGQMQPEQEEEEEDKGQALQRNSEADKHLRNADKIAIC